MLRNLVASLILVAFASGSAWAQTTGDYAIAAGDRLDVSILEDPTLNRQVLVRPDGKISLPLAGTIDVAGRTPETAASMIRQRLSKHFVAAPNVTVALSATAFSAAVEEAALLPSYYVVGEVNNPGRFTFDEEKPVSVLQALSMSGGPGVFAARSRIQIRRYSGGTESLLIFDYGAVDSGESIGAPPMIEDGDIIVVPERGLFK